MAFNPFRAFRKHQKVFFAGLTILCMVTFVMCGSMGQGDFFGTIANVFTGRSRASAIATLYGKDISAKEIQELRSQRRLESQYMLSFTASARNEVIREAYEASRKWDDSQQFFSPKQIVQGLYELRENSSRSRQDSFQYLNTLQQVQPLLPRLANTFIQANKSAEADIVEHFARALQQEWDLYQRPRTQLYFGGTSSLEDCLDFMIWRHEADRRGIQLTRQDTSDLLLRETGNQGIPRSEQKKIEQALTQSFRTFNAESFRTALA